MLECIFIYIIFLFHVTLSRLSRSKPKSPTEVCYRNTLKNAWHCVTAWHRTLPVKQPNYKLIFIYYYSNTYFIPILILFQYLFYSNTYFIPILIIIQILIFIQILILFKYLFYFYSNTKSWWVWWIHVWIVDEVGKVGKLALLFTNFSNLPLYGRLYHFRGRFSHLSHLLLYLYRIYYSILSL